MKKIIVALPTCGKTYACKQMNLLSRVRGIDLDIRGLKYLDTKKVRQAQTILAKTAFEAGCDYLFTHNGALDFSLLNPDDGYECDIYIRDISSVKAAGLAERRGDSLQFQVEVLKEYGRWVDDMWRLFDNLSERGFKTRIILLGECAHIWDNIRHEVLTLNAMRCAERK